MISLCSRTVTAILFAANLLFIQAATAAEVSVSIPVTQIQYGATGVKSGAGELQAGPAYGDLSRGAHGTFIKMPAGFVSPVHTHSADYYAVVISGVGVNTQDGRNDVALPVGSYWLQKGGEPHVTKCISPNECIFFLVQPAKFDYVGKTGK
jgi:quercetin dioxygenase-like cupin family protein